MPRGLAAKVMQTRIGILILVPYSYALSVDKLEVQ
jgi:hypothetical protein